MKYEIERAEKAEAEIVSLKAEIDRLRAELATSRALMGAEVIRLCLVAELRTPLGQQVYLEASGFADEIRALAPLPVSLVAVERETLERIDAGAIGAIEAIECAVQGRSAVASITLSGGRDHCLAIRAALSSLLKEPGPMAGRKPKSLKR